MSNIFFAGATLRGFSTRGVSVACAPEAFCTINFTFRCWFCVTFFFSFALEITFQLPKKSTKADLQRRVYHLRPIPLPFTIMISPHHHPPRPTPITREHITQGFRQNRTPPLQSVLLSCHFAQPPPPTPYLRIATLISHIYLNLPPTTPHPFPHYATYTLHAIIFHFFSSLSLSPLYR